MIKAIWLSPIRIKKDNSVPFYPPGIPMCSLFILGISVGYKAILSFSNIMKLTGWKRADEIFFGDVIVFKNIINLKVVESNYSIISILLSGFILI